MIENIKNVIFFSNGDESTVHISKGFVKDYMNIIKTDNYYFAHNYNYNLIDNIKNIPTKYKTYDLINFDQIPTYIIDNDTLLINMNGCQENPKYSNYNNDYIRYKTIHSNIIKSILNIDFDAWSLPTIDNQLCDINNIEAEFAAYRNFGDMYILVCNNDNYSNNSDFIFDDEITKYILDYVFTYYKTHVILTKKIKYQHQNLHYIDSSNKNNISYISAKVDIILGNLSNEHMFSFVQENITRNSMISLSNNKNDGIWFTEQPNNIIWSNNFDFENITKLLDNKIKNSQ